MIRLLAFLIMLPLVGMAQHEHHDLPWRFVQNNGQFHKNVSFKVPVPSGALYLEKKKLTYHLIDSRKLVDFHLGKKKLKQTSKLDHHIFNVDFLNTSNSCKIIPKGKQEYFENYFVLNKKNEWATNVPVYDQVTYQNLYDGVDLKFYGLQSELKYDLIVHPKANAKSIQFQYNGLHKISIRSNRLVLKTELGEILEEKPYAYQIIDNVEREVPCKFKLESNTLTFEFPDGYNNDFPLIIDPVLIFSTFSGSSIANFGYTATYDKFGYLYSGSTAFGTGYDTTLGAFQTTWAGGTGGGSTGTDIAITKWDTSGTYPIYSTYLGGESDEMPHSLIVNEQGELFVMGTTSSLQFPVTSNAFDTTFNQNASTPAVSFQGLGVLYPNGSDLCIVKFNEDGTDLLTSTYLGGTRTDGINQGVLKFNYADEARGEILIDQNGDVLIVTSTNSIDIPQGLTPGVMPTKPSNINSQDGVIFKLTSDLSTLKWSTYMGGSAFDALYSVETDSENNIYVTGGTTSNNLPVLSGGFDPSFNGSQDGFVIHIDKDGDLILHGSYYGTLQYDQSYFVETDKEDNVYLFGQTSGSSGSLINNATYNDPNGGQFITKMSPDLSSCIWQTRFGRGDGNPDISPTAFLVDLCNSIYLSGWGSQILAGTNLTTNGLDTAGQPYQGTTDNNDLYLMVLSDDASSLLYGSFIGGSAREHVDGGTCRFDKKGKIYQAVCAGCPAPGQGSSSDFPTHPNPGAHSNVNGTTSSCNLAVFKMDFLLPTVVSDFFAPIFTCETDSVHFTNLSLIQNATTFFWDFGDNSTSTQENPSHLYAAPGTYEVKLAVSDLQSCNLTDTFSLTVKVGDLDTINLADAVSCNGSAIPIGIPTQGSYTYKWSPTTFLSDSTIANPVVTPLVDIQYNLIAQNAQSCRQYTQQVLIDTIQTVVEGDTLVCSTDFPIPLTGRYSGNSIALIWSSSSNFSDTLNVAGDSVISINPTTPISTYYFKAVTALGCESIDSITVKKADITNPLEANFSTPLAGCAPYSIQFNNLTFSQGNAQYQWSFDNNTNSQLENPSAIFSQAGVYDIVLIATDTTICPQVDTVTKQLIVLADSSYSLDFEVCPNLNSTIGLSPDTHQATTYEWIPTTGLSDSTQSNPFVNLNAPTSFLLIKKGICIDSIVNNVMISPIELSLPNDQLICSDNRNVTINAIGNGTLNQYLWSTNAIFNDTVYFGNDSVNVLSPLDSIQTFYLKGFSGHGCQIEDSMTVFVSDEIIRLPIDPALCFDDSLWLTALYPAIVKPSFQWLPTNEILSKNDSSSVLVNPKVNTTFTVQSVDQNGCNFSGKIDVLVSSLSPASISTSATPDSIFAGQKTTLDIVPKGNFSYDWNPNTTLSAPNADVTDAFPTNTTTYTVNIIDNDFRSCRQEGQVTVFLKELICDKSQLFVPNAFTPNADGKHDKFIVKAEILKQYNLQIFNRLGELVFESNSPQDQWDGTINGKHANAEVFVYQLRGTCFNNETLLKKGNVTLIR